jgi:release factor glutamine methyltransferase
MNSLNLFKSLINKTIKPLIEIYLSKDRNYKYGDIHLTIFKGVFHPGLFFSTKILLGYLKQFDLTNTTFLELGAGSGLISIYASKKNGKVTATDISELSVKNIKHNSDKNNSGIRIIHSNLFETIPQEKFDFILINPPYYKKDPKTENEFAWYCGEHSEYFIKFFRELSAYVHPQTKAIMVLSEDCNLEEIKSIALKNNFQILLKKKYFRYWEINYVFEIVMA